MAAFDMIAFDADDTLWHTERLYDEVVGQIKPLLVRYHHAGDGKGAGDNDGAEYVEHILRQIDMDNIGYYGYGVKGFALSLIEAAIEISAGCVPGAQLKQVIDLAKRMLTAQIQFVDYAEEILASLAKSYRLMLITKGDLFEQEAKIARSGLKTYFSHIEIVSDKTRDAYAAILARYGIAPDRFLIVGDSLRSDILPVIALGGTAVHIPTHLKWAHEVVSVPDKDRGKYVELEHIGLLPAWIETLSTRLNGA